jgi:hypothetical protein
MLGGAADYVDGDDPDDRHDAQDVEPAGVGARSRAEGPGSRFGRVANSYAGREIGRDKRVSGLKGLQHLSVMTRET